MSALQSFVSSERTSSSASRNSAVLGVLLGVAAVVASCSSDAPATGDRVAPESSAQPTSSVAIEISTIDTTAPLVPTAAGTETTTRTAPSVGLYALTGLSAPDEESLLRPAIAAKIDNVEAARPQAGLVQADLVYEEIVEGGLTRLLAIFHSTSAPVVGPIRSARSTDVPLLTPLREPLFAWSGANEAFAAFIRSFAIRDVGVEAEPGAYERLPDRSPPSDLMTSTDALYALISLGEDLAPKLILEHLMPGELPRSGEAVDSVAIDYGATTVTHRWEAELGGWVRFQNESRHVDIVGDAIAPEKRHRPVRHLQGLRSGRQRGRGRACRGVEGLWVGLVPAKWSGDNGLVDQVECDDCGPILRCDRRADGLCGRADVDTSGSRRHRFASLIGS